MKSVLTTMLTCAVLFGISFFATSQMRSSDEEPTDETTELETPPDATAEDEEAGPGMVKAMPVSLRPDNAVTVEAVLQMSDSIKKMEQQLAPAGNARRQEGATGQNDVRGPDHRTR